MNEEKKVYHSHNIKSLSTKHAYRIRV